MWVPFSWLQLWDLSKLPTAFYSFFIWTIRKKATVIPAWVVMKAESVTLSVSPGLSHRCRSVPITSSTLLLWELPQVGGASPWSAPSRITPLIAPLPWDSKTEVATVHLHRSASTAAFQGLPHSYRGERSCWQSHSFITWFSHFPLFLSVSWEHTGSFMLVASLCLPILSWKTKSLSYTMKQELERPQGDLEGIDNIGFYF